MLKKSEELSYKLGRDRHAWLQVARGRATLNGNDLGPGDGASATGGELVLRASADAEVLLFDLA